MHIPRVCGLPGALSEHQAARAAAVRRALVVFGALVLPAACALGVGAVAVLAHEDGGRGADGRTGGGLLGLAGRAVQAWVHNEYLSGTLAREAPQLGGRGEAARPELDAFLRLV